MSKKNSADKNSSKKKGNSRFPGVRWYLKNDGNKTYYFVYYDKIKKKHRHVGGFRTADSANAARSEAIGECRRKAKRGVAKGERLVRDLVKGWPDDWRGRRKESTLAAYRSGIRPFLEEFGDVPLDDLNRSDCHAWGRRQKHWSLSPARVFLRDLKRSGDIPENYLLDVELPAAPGRSDYPPLSTAQVWHLIETSQRVLPRNVGDQVAGLIATSAFMGTRLGETLAFGGSAINLEQGIATISKQITKSGQFTLPKHGIRQSAVSPYLLDAWDKLGVDLEATPLFSPPTVTYFTATNFYRSFEKVVAASGIQGLDFHELRHYHQTWLTFLEVHPWALNDHIGHAHPGSKDEKLYTHLQKMGFRKVNQALSIDAEPLVPGEDRAEYIPQKVIDRGRRL